MSQVELMITTHKHKPNEIKGILKKNMRKENKKNNRSRV